MRQEGTTDGVWQEEWHNESYSLGSARQIMDGAKWKNRRWKEPTFSKCLLPAKHFTHSIDPLNPHCDPDSYAHFIEGQLRFRNCKRCYSYVEEQRSEPIWIEVSFLNLYVFCCISHGLEKGNLMMNSEMKVRSQLKLGMAGKGDEFWEIRR